MELKSVTWFIVLIFVMQEISSHPLLDYGEELIPQIFHIGEDTTARDCDLEPEINPEYPCNPQIECQYGHRRWKNAYLVPRPKHSFKSACSSAMQFVPNIISSLIASLLPPPLASLPLPPAICPV